MVQASVLTSNAETEISVSTGNAETQVEVSTSDVGVQRDFRTKLVNFGLPPGLSLSAVIWMTRQQGTNVGRLVFFLEKEYFEQWQREFMVAERSNVWAMISMAAAVRRDEDCEISEWGSSFEAEARFESFNITARLKQCLSVPLTMLYNQSLSVGYVPPGWHAAHIVPVHEKGVYGDVSNYRPISLTCVTSKIFE